MSDSGGFLDGLKSKANDAFEKIKEIAGSPAPPAPPAPSAPPAPPTEPTVKDKILYYLTVAIIIIVPILFAVIVANEMIIYRPSIRVFYFILTWILCFLFTSFRVIIFVYYLIRWAFNRYKQSEGVSSGFFPKIYALIPWSTDYKTIWPLRYLTPDIGDTPLEQAFGDNSFQKDLKKAYYLGEKMVEYFEILESANPYREYPAYKENFANVTKSLFEMHMPGLKIDHAKKEYIIRVHGGDKPEFVKIAEHSMVPDIKKSVTPDETGIPMVQYNKGTKTFTLASMAQTTAQTTAEAPMPSTLPSPTAPPMPSPTAPPMPPTLPPTLTPQ